MIEDGICKEAVANFGGIEETTGELCRKYLSFFVGLFYGLAGNSCASCASYVSQGSGRQAFSVWFSKVF